MSLRSLPDSFLPETVAAIDARLDGICTEHGVSIPLAIESGSRAWGFPSPDSDYDCRFIFVRPLEQHLTPWPKRDVIETPLEGDLDVNGWELGKAIKLLLKGSAVIIEWLRSPIAYRGEAWFRDAFLEFAKRFASRDLIARHYLHLGERQRRIYFGDGKAVPQKKIFYALRPAAALRWLHLHREEAVAPMHFPSLMAECDPPTNVQDVIANLLHRKAVSRELGAEPLPAPIAAFIDSEFEVAKARFVGQRAMLSDEAKHEAERLFRNATVRCFGPNST
jgi:predicted nucleotidyltransferase